MQKELKPCPWCGGKEPEIYIAYELESTKTKLYNIQCCENNCITSYNLDTEEAVQKAWNTRPIEDELRARVKELEAKLLNEITINHDLKTEKEDLEAWQKEAVPLLVHYRQSFNHQINKDVIELEKYKEERDKLETLIKQAKDN